MVKPKEEVIAQFNQNVNMTAEELQAWLDDAQSDKAGTGVGIESGHKIIEILKKNPEKDPEKYDEEDIEHMRKVVSYHARHLAQEDHLKETKTENELENTKSTISLKNWGHNPIKVLHEGQETSQNDTSKPAAIKEDTDTKNGTAGTDNDTRTTETGAHKRKQTDDKTEGAEAVNREKGPSTSGLESHVELDPGYISDTDSDEKDITETHARKKSKTNEKQGQGKSQVVEMPVGIDKSA